MNQDPNPLVIIGGLICVGGFIPILYLASIFGPSLPGWTLLVPVAIGGTLMLWSMVFGPINLRHTQENKS